MFSPFFTLFHITKLYLLFMIPGTFALALGFIYLLLFIISGPESQLSTTTSYETIILLKYRSIFLSFLILMKILF